MEVPFRDTAAVLFDLDGTLIDSIDLILRSYHHTLAAHEKPPVTDAQLLQHVGTPLWAHLRPYADDEAEVDAMVTTYRAWNLEHHDELVRPFDGAVDAVAALRSRGVRVAVVTSKSRVAALRGLEHSGYRDLVEVLVGADDVDVHKPDPAPVTRGLELLGVEPAAAVYVGDAIVDIQAGNAAGVRTAAALWGPFDRAHLEGAGPTVWLESPIEIAGLA